MASLKDLSSDQIQRIIDLKEQIEALESEIESIGGGKSVVSSASGKKGRRKNRMSAAGRAAIAAAVRARWAKLRGGSPKADKKKDKRRSPAVRAKLAAIARARWKKAKAAGKVKL